MKGVFEVGREPRSLPFDVENEAAKEAEDAPGEGVRQEGLQDALLPVSDVPEKTAESDGLR